MKIVKLDALTFIICMLQASLYAQTWQSNIVFTGGDGKLMYVADADGNRIPDFSFAGYKNGSVPIPNIAVLDYVSPIAGDNTSNIQNAINRVAACSLDVNGFRGALLMKAGIYRVSGKLTIKASGVVLRGVGEGSDSTSNTIILATGDSTTQTTVITAGGGSDTKWSNQVTGTQTNITSDTVYVGSRTFQVADASQYSVGDNIVIYHPCTDLWLQAVQYGATAGGYVWAVGNIPIFYNRYITAKNGNSITVDAPVFNTLVKSLSQAYIYKYTRTGLMTNIGIENLRIDIRTTDVTTNANGNEHDHAWDAIRLIQIEDAWVRHCTALHFGQSGFKTSTATRVTIDSCSALDPISIITGERRYNFNVYQASQLILFRNCSASHGRHDYVSNGISSTSGCVFVDCRSESTYASSEGHRWWSQGLLYDNITFISPITSGIVLGLYNRGNAGTGHGWASAHSVAWNCIASGKNIIIQKPPTAQNYAIGCMGNVTGIMPPAPFDQPQGYIEGTDNLGLNPRSLYHAQLAERMNPTSGQSDDRMMRQMPADFSLEQNYPNPFNPSTIIRYQIPVSSNVQLTILDCLGRAVNVLVDKVQKAGYYRVEWNAAQYPSGVYFCRLRTEYRTETRKLLLVK